MFYGVKIVQVHKIYLQVQLDVDRPGGKNLTYSGFYVKLIVFF